MTEPSDPELPLSDARSVNRLPLDFWTLEAVALRTRTIEFGPGPGLTTDVLSSLTDDLIAVEKSRLRDASFTAVRVDEGAVRFRASRSAGNR